MPQPHKHKDVIIAWANGEVIQGRRSNTTGDWETIHTPRWAGDFDYRVKPKDKVKKYIFAFQVKGVSYVSVTCKHCKNAKELQKALKSVNVEWMERIDASMIEVEEE